MPTAYKWFPAVAVVLVLALPGCAAHDTPAANADPYGFFSGVWHGIIFLFSLFGCFVSWLLSLVGISFLAGVEIIGRPNTGFWYYVGFVLGLCAHGGAGAS